MSNEGPTFPAVWPENCPPADATDSEIVVYRTVGSNPPAPGDFLSYAEEGKRITDPRKKCMAHGMSVMQLLADAEHHREILRWKKQYIAQAKLTAEHGKTKSTPSGQFPSHLTWWCFESLKREAIFNVIEE